MRVRLPQVPRPTRLRLSSQPPLLLILRRAAATVRPSNSNSRSISSRKIRISYPVSRVRTRSGLRPGLRSGIPGAVAEYAPEPPPPLPEYQQPPCPEPNYIWTPGYWSYAPAGYYWVPGVWAAAPYVGALWTPGYWGYNAGRYGWHQGYWGRYIGYYGGVNYGNGYVGRGYYGGYWNNNQFNYNRQVTNINTTVIHNTYIRNVTNITTYNRVSYSGGRGGVNLQPSPAEMAALRQPRLAPLAVQQQHRIEASTNRAQFVAVNRGQPQTVVAAKPLPVEHHQPALVPVQPRQQPDPPSSGLSRNGRCSKQRRPSKCGQRPRSGRCSP